MRWGLPRGAQRVAACVWLGGAGRGWAALRIDTPPQLSPVGPLASTPRVAVLACACNTASSLALMRAALPASPALPRSWVSAYTAASATCDSRSSASSCSAAGNITGVDTTKCVLH
jgi:hypothetical protein